MANALPLAQWRSNCSEDPRKSAPPLQRPPTNHASLTKSLLTPNVVGDGSDSERKSQTLQPGSPAGACFVSTEARSQKPQIL